MVIQELIQEAIDTCPVDCIHWLDHAEVKKLKKSGSIRLSHSWIPGRGGCRRCSPASQKTKVIRQKLVIEEVRKEGHHGTTEVLISSNFGCLTSAWA